MVLPPPARAGMNPRAATPSLLKQAAQPISLLQQAWYGSRRFEPAACGRTPISNPRVAEYAGIEYTLLRYHPYNR
jgi:hypothetical protein